MADPLAGKREALNAGEVEVLTWPDQAKCPVAKGKVFPLRSCHVEITHTQRKLVKGQWVWEARVFRHLPDTPQVPASQHGLAHPPQYVKGSHGAVDGIGEEVPRDFREKLAEEGRLKTVMQGNRNRKRAAVLGAEQRLLDARKKGRTATVTILEKKLEHDRKKAA